MQVNTQYHCVEAPIAEGQPLPSSDSFAAKIKMHGAIDQHVEVVFFVNPNQWVDFGSNLLDLGMALLKAARERAAKEQEAITEASDEPG